MLERFSRRSHAAFFERGQEAERVSKAARKTGASTKRDGLTCADPRTMVGVGPIFK
jgi:hypothetical protein